VPAQHPRYTSGMAETWDLLQSPPAGAVFNMALDEALLQTASKRGRPLLRAYSWEKPSVSFGYFQKFPAHLADGYEMVRRPTGGGVVYHVDDTTYTVVVPPEHALFTMSTTDAYWLLHKAVAAAFEMRPGLRSCARVSDSAQNADRRSPTFNGRPAVSPSARSGDLRATDVALFHARPRSLQGQYECFQKPVHGDVVLDGQKLAGGAQRRTRCGMLHQGSIAAKLSTEQLRQSFQEMLGVEFEAYEISDTERALAEKLTREKYATDAWNRYLR
jgi:lipoate-protein ligase A